MSLPELKCCKKMRFKKVWCCRINGGGVFDLPVAFWAGQSIHIRRGLLQARQILDFQRVAGVFRRRKVLSSGKWPFHFPVFGVPGW